MKDWLTSAVITALVTGIFGIIAAWLAFLFGKKKQAADIEVQKASAAKTMAEARQTEANTQRTYSEDALKLLDGMRVIAMEFKNENGELRIQIKELQEQVSTLEQKTIELTETCAKREMAMMEEFSRREMAMMEEFSTKYGAIRESNHAIRGALNGIQLQVQLNAKSQEATNEQLRFLILAVDRLEGNGPPTPVPQSE